MRSRRIIVASSFALFTGALVACGGGNPWGELLDGKAGPDADGVVLEDGGASSVDAARRDASADDDGGRDIDGGDGSAVDPLDPPSVCPAIIDVGPGTVMPFSTPSDDRALSVSADELSAVWTTIAGSVVTIHYVDRASVNDAFGPPRTLNGSFAKERVAIGPDGLELAVVNRDGLGFSLLSRGSRAEAFGAPEVGPFELLDEQGESVLEPAGERYGDPLFGRGGSYFIFSRYGHGATTTVFVGTRIFPGDSFSPGTPFAEAALGARGDARRIVTGVSADVRTLFVWDQIVNKSRVVRLNAEGEITGSADVGDMRDLQTSEDCTTFYFARGAPADLFRYRAP